MDWSMGFSSSYYATIVDPATWRDIDRLEITKGSVSRSATNSLRESADIDGLRVDISKEYWVRLWLNARQDGESVREALFTGLMICPKKSINGQIVTLPMECYSVLKPADDVLLPRGYYVPAETNGANVVKQLLSVSPAPIVVENNSPLLVDAIIAENGESNLSMADKILSAMGWRLRISGDGTITVCPKASESSIILGTNYDIVEPEVDVERDWYDCPNVFRAVSDELYAIARDDSEDSLLSTVNRKREVWAEEMDCKLNDGEGIAEYALRRLKELQSYGKTVSYSRRYVPGIVPGDIITLNYPGIEDLAIDNYSIQSQSISLDKGVTVNEEIAK